MKENKKPSFMVGCAIIIKDKRILIAQRPPGTYMAGFWEFPGGKAEKDESLEDCLCREIKEELGFLIKPHREIAAMVHEYPERILDLRFVLCDWVSGTPQAIECSDFRWVTPRELKNFVFPKADEEVIDYLISNERDYIN